MSIIEIEILFGLVVSLGCGSYAITLAVRDLYTGYLLDNQIEPYTSSYNQYIDAHVGQGIYTGCEITPSAASRLSCPPSVHAEGRFLINMAKAHALNISEDLPVYVATTGVILGGLGLLKCKKQPPSHEKIEQRLLPHRQLHQRLQATKLKVNDAPDEFYDPLYMVLMDEPIKTSSSNGAIQKTYNAQTLLSLKKCPYSRTPLVVIGPDLELKQRIRAYVEKKEKLAEKIKTAGALVEEKKQSAAHASEGRRRGRRR